MQSFLSPDGARQRRHHGFRVDQPSGQVEVGRMRSGYALGTKQKEWELIVGGEYEVLEVDKAILETAVVRRREVATIGSSAILGGSTFP